MIHFFKTYPYLKMDNKCSISSKGKNKNLRAGEIEKNNDTVLRRYKYYYFLCERKKWM